MARTVQCVKLGQELPGVIYKPFDYDLGERIYAPPDYRPEH